jgi:hypothetical protein
MPTAISLGGDDMTTIPTRQQIADQIRALLQGSETRQAVSAWAIQFVTDEHHRVTDMAAWEMLKTLGGADMIVDLEGNHLYGPADFEKWLEELTR